MSPKLIIIDDTSPDIVYSGQWSAGGVEQELNHTTHGSWTNGSQAAIYFTGTSIEVYGTVGREHNNGDPAFSPITTYVIDGKNGSTSTFTATPGTSIMFKQLFYRSPKLKNGQHQLVVTLTNSNMNAAWIDYFQVEQSTSMAPGLIAGIIVSAVVGLLLLLIIGILLRRISRLSRRQVQYEKVPRKASQAYWPWMSSPPDVTPFGSDPFSETAPLSTHTARPFPLDSQPRLSVQHPELELGTSLSGYTTRGGTYADKTSPVASTNRDRNDRNSNTSGFTSLSGYTTQGGSFADKTASTSSPTSARSSRQSPTVSPTSASGYTVQGSSVGDKLDRRSQQATNSTTGSSNRDYLSTTSTTLDLIPRPFAATTTNRPNVAGEEAPPPAYGRSILG